MSSYIMHICISDIVKRKYNLSTKFIYGSILPDILKQTGSDRDTTHYIVKNIVGEDIRNLPDIAKAISDMEVLDIDKEIKLGYIAHLIEDYIWFNKYIPAYAEKLDNGQVEYLKDGSLHEAQEFSHDMYLDYANAATYVITKCGTDIEEIKNTLCGLIQDEDKLKVVLKYTKYTDTDNIFLNKFMTKESMDKYIREATEEVEKMVLKLLGEK